MKRLFKYVLATPALVFTVLFIPFKSHSYVYVCKTSIEEPPDFFEMRELGLEEPVDHLRHSSDICYKFHSTRSAMLLVTYVDKHQWSEAELREIFSR